jgi:hypothetical protein
MATGATLMGVGLFSEYIAKGLSFLAPAQDRKDAIMSLHYNKFAPFSGIYQEMMARLRCCFIQSTCSVISFLWL